MGKLIVLCSGGFDSVVLTKYLAQDNNDVITLFFDYGQRNAIQEREKALKVSIDTGCEFREIKIPSLDWCKSALYNEESKDQYIPMRNLIFLSYAVSLAESLGVKEIYTAFIRIPNEEYYPDTSPEFLDHFNNLVKSSGVTVIAPIQFASKEQLIPDARVLGVKEGDFFSCNTPTKEGNACGECFDCEDIFSMYSQGINPFSLEDIFLDNNFKIDNKFIEEVKESKITFAKIFVNNQCQFRCKHCLYGFSETFKPELSLAEWEQVLLQLSESGIKNIDFGGKEPLYNTKVFKLMEFIREKELGINCSLITNGATIKKYIDLIKEYLPCITLSVESLNEVCSRTTSKFLVENIKLLIENKVSVSVSIDVYGDTYKEVPSIINELIALGVKSIYLKPILPLGKKIKYSMSRMILPRQYWELAGIVRSIDVSKDVHLLMDFPKLFTTELLNTDLGFREFIYQCVVPDRIYMYGSIELSFEFFPADFSKSLAITSDGYVLGCGQDISEEHYYKKSVGNLRKYTLDFLINKGKIEVVSTLRSLVKLV